MNSSHRLIVIALTVFLMTALGTVALAQNDEDHQVEDYSSTPLVQPTIEDFAPIPESDIREDGKPVAEAPMGINGYFEVSEQQKVFSLTPSYRFSEKFALKARFPYIIERKRNYFGGEASASGLGDIGLDGEYTHRFNSPSKLLRLQATVKLPTGNNENIEGDDEVKVPLGTGSVDLMLRAQFTRSTKKSGFLAAALFRKNTSGESVFQSTWWDGTVQTQTITTTNGNEFVASAFGRYVVGSGIWLNLGASLMMTGNGEMESHTTDTGGGDWSNSDELFQKSTLLDLFPGVSYKFGPITPYLGARIPLSTSYDNDFLLEERDTVFIFQLTYRPLAMVD